MFESTAIESAHDLGHEGNVSSWRPPAGENRHARGRSESYRGRGERVTHLADCRPDRYFGDEELIGNSPVMADLLAQMELVAETDVTVLLEGETGAGKDLVARTLHRMSSRSGGPFVAFNAPNLSEQLFESELFGHVRGAFSGAVGAQEGLARAAEGGTLFIDEVGELPLNNQAKLLRFLDTKEVRPVGSTRARRVDVRIVCATNRDLRQEVREGRFREDLYYRLRVISLRIPALRERRDDIPVLVDHFLRRLAARHGRPVPELSPEVRDLLLGHDWEGNVRELVHEMERAVVLTPPGKPIAPVVLSTEIKNAANRQNRPGPDSASTLREARRDMERQLVLDKLDDTGWNVSAAARELDISRVGLCKKLKRLGIERPS